MRPVDPLYSYGPATAAEMTLRVQPKGQVKPIRVYFDSPTLQVRTRRGVGFHFICECGEIGSRRKQRSQAVWDLRRHTEDEHPK